MPSSQSVARTLEQLRIPNSRLTLGVAAGVAATVATVGAASASTAPASATHATDAASQSGVRVEAAPVQQQAGPAVRIAEGMQVKAPAPSYPAAAPAATPQQASTTAASAAAGADTASQSGVQVQAAPVQQQAGPATRIGEGMQLLVPAPSHPAAAATAAPQHAAAAPAQPAAAAQPTAAPAQPAAPAAPPQPYQLYDSVTPSALPSSSQAVAVYANGSYAAQPSQVGKRGLTLWIDTNASDPHADVLDVEPGDATPSQAAAWAQQKLNASPNSIAIVYTMRSDWGAVQAAVSQLPWWMPSHVKYWIADPTGVPHLVPGSDATQWYWGQNYDISTALPSFN